MSETNVGRLILLSGINGFLAVALGAYGAHGLKAPDPAALEAFRTGAQYHMVHALALLGLTVLATRKPVWAQLSSLFFLAGIVLFSGSLYYLGITGSRSLVMITPLGGLSFLAGWVIVSFAGWHLTRAPASATSPTPKSSKS